MTDEALQVIAMTISTSATTDVVPRGGSASAKVSYVTTPFAPGCGSYVLEAHPPTPRGDGELAVDWAREAALFGTESLEWAESTIGAVLPTQGDTE
jgi:hypothetical protein